MKNFIFKKNICISFATSLLIIFSYTHVSAQSVGMRSDDTVYNINDTFLVEVRLDAMGRSINSVEGKIYIPKEYFDVLSIKTGDSIISLWSERPKYNSNSGEITFSGGLIGGYSGSDGPIFSYVLKVKKEGSTQINFEQFDAYLNDGYATLVSDIKRISSQYTLLNDPNRESIVYSDTPDMKAPESITLYVSRDVSVANNKYFVSFFANDKGDGVIRYEVEERPWIISWLGIKKVWKDTQTPQVLAYQNWISTIIVRAIDESGNIQEEKIVKFFIFDNHIIFYILLLTCLLFISKKYTKRMYNKK